MLKQVIAIATGTSICAISCCAYLNADKFNKYPENRIVVTGDATRRAIIIGAGVAGISTAYHLSKRSYDVTIIDAAKYAGSECSAVAAGGMKRSNPLVSCETWKEVVRSMVPELSRSTSKFSFFHVNLRECLFDIHFWRWITDFTFKSLIYPSEESLLRRQDSMLYFTDWAITLLIRKLNEDNGRLAEVCGLNTRGALRFHYEAMENLTIPKNTLEPTEILTSEKEIARIEPSTKNLSKVPRAAEFEPSSAMANSEAFTWELSKELEEGSNKVQFLYETAVQTLEFDKRKNRVSRVRTNKGIIEVDENTEVIVAAGSWSPLILATIGVFVPVYPLKGYCISFDLPSSSAGRPDEEDLPSRTLTDSILYTTRMGNQIRIASMGEFDGWNTCPIPYVDSIFRKEAEKQFPILRPFIKSAKTRCGLRPFTSDGVSLIGRVDGFKNLSINVGPGFNGWKIGYGMGELLARRLSGEDTAELPFDCTSMDPSTRVKKSPLFCRLAQLNWK